MTATSYLFVDEAVRDAVEPIVRKAGIIPDGVSVHVRVPREWSDIWDASLFPDEGRATVFAYREAQKLPADGSYFMGLRGRTWVREPLGTVSWKTRFSIEDEGFGKFIEAEPSSVAFEADGHGHGQPQATQSCSK